MSDQIIVRPIIPQVVVSGVGPQGPGATLAYVHTQGVASATWVVTHNLGWNPNVTVQDSAGTTVEGDTVYNSVNQLTINFVAAFAGTAYLS